MAAHRNQIKNRSEIYLKTKQKLKETHQTLFIATGVRCVFGLYFIKQYFDAKSFAGNTFIILTCNGHVLV